MYKLLCVCFMVIVAIHYFYFCIVVMTWMMITQLSTKVRLDNGACVVVKPQCSFPHLILAAVPLK